VRIYLAGASANIAVCEYWMAQLRTRGHTITLDWTVPIRENAAAGRTDAALSVVEKRHYARADLDAIKSADMVWVLAPAGPSTGAWVEMGYALALRPTSLAPWLVVSGPHDRCIFASLASQTFSDHAQAFDWICAT
jgi:nucleoside 2-deoxyribosyltransferase